LKQNDTLLRLENVWKIYQMGEVEFAALKGVNLEIDKGEFVAILGPSGSGKSTMMNLIGCLDLPSRGVVHLAQIRGKKIGFIFQQFNLIPTLSVLENVMLPLEFQEVATSVAQRRGLYLLEMVGLKDRVHHLPSQLSGGERQRVAIARSLAVDPDIILADEPTGNLDSKTGEYILDFLNGLHTNEGKTIIIVTHDLNIVKYAEKVVHIKDGEIEKVEYT